MLPLLENVLAGFGEYASQYGAPGVARERFAQEKLSDHRPVSASQADGAVKHLGAHGASTQVRP
jgi:hypothetical protein